MQGHILWEWAGEASNTHPLILKSFWDQEVLGCSLLVYSYHMKDSALGLFWPGCVRWF